MELYRLHRAAALMFALLALPPGYYALTMPWADRVDFDVIGFLWLMQNLPQLTAWSLTFAFLFGAVVMALRARWRV